MLPCIPFCGDWWARRAEERGGCVNTLLPSRLSGCRPLPQSLSEGSCWKAGPRPTAFLMVGLILNLPGLEREPELLPRISVV